MSSRLVFKISVVIVAALFLYMLRGPLYFLYITPFGNYNPDDTPQPLDYELESSWAELPDQEALMTDRAQVFFVHPTSLRSRFAWNEEPGAPDSKERFNWARTWQLPAFESCCRIYAPFYRQATLAAYWRNESGRQARDLAYGDVLRAFDSFITSRWQQESGFILAGHSQGSEHILRLLHDRVIGKDLEKYLIVALAPGIPVPKAAYEKTHGEFPLCDGPEQTGCLLAWSTFMEGKSTNDVFSRADWYFPGYGYQTVHEDQFHCVNPLNWRANGEQKVEPRFHLQSHLDDGEAKTFAQCSPKGLFVDSLEDAVQFELDGNYHLYDLGLFMGNLKTNMKTRVDAYAASQAQRTL
ncbi:DUF3089 domain-containing protein [Pseudobacteriovorax antillogorgiicola]|uniref:DUF3089 domain-containing protein n=1 Tax=Pseudobacteriovorax antillogorgiicola TaxID=1513793 RepID=A0A1Y6CHR0_9BACT|nr:DUF3089 domain-containing protein [Pseudobacteriovorax antillogorgiicola]TCS46999.1 DUF3089 family protein [Pseudobacteriovorax antillogorgiicola]SMF64933.1 Protein of unknown function [Pseudobacteriovorax antillogorgiicola]